MYQLFIKVIEKANVVVSTYENIELMGKTILDPTLGNVAFGSGKDQWAFTLTFFSKFYSKKFGIE